MKGTCRWSEPGQKLIAHAPRASQHSARGTAACRILLSIFREISPSRVRLSRAPALEGDVTVISRQRCLVDVRNLLCYIRAMAKAHKPSSGSSARAKRASDSSSKMLKKKNLTPPHPPQRGVVEMVDPRVQAQLKLYDEALALFHQQKFSRAKQELEKVLEGPSKELSDRARMHIKIAEQRMKPATEQNPRTADEHYQRGVAMMNVGRVDDAG